MSKFQGNPLAEVHKDSSDQRVARVYPPLKIAHKIVDLESSQLDVTLERFIKHSTAGSESQTLPLPRSLYLENPDLDPGR
jgi:hypothetical protein